MMAPCPKATPCTRSRVTSTRHTGARSRRRRSPQGKFAAGAALISGRTFVHATSWGKHLFAEFEDDAWLHVHLGLIGTFRSTSTGMPVTCPWWARSGCGWPPTTTWRTCAARTCAPSSRPTWWRR